MDLISDHKVFHGGTYNTNPISMAAGLATFREILTRENYAHVEKISKKLVDGYRRIIGKVGLQGYVAFAGANGALMFAPQEIRNYRDWLGVDVELWKHYWFGMVNRGVMAQPYWWDEQWTMSVQHTEADIEKHLSALEDLAPALAKAQQEHGKTAWSHTRIERGGGSSRPVLLCVVIPRCAGDEDLLLRARGTAPENCSETLKPKPGSHFCRPPHPDQPHLKRVLGRFDLVLLFVVAVFNLNVVPSIAANGGVTVWLWIISLLLFFWPQGIAVIELAQRYPGEGGVYLWAKEVFGDFHGFFSGWCYWTNNMLYVPTVMLYFVGVSVFALGPARAGLADNKAFAMATSVGSSCCSQSSTSLDSAWGSG